MPLKGRQSKNVLVDTARAPLLRSAAIGPVMAHLAEADLLVETLPFDKGHSLEAGIEQAVVDQLVLFEFRPPHDQAIRRDISEPNTEITRPQVLEEMRESRTLGHLVEIHRL